MPKWKLEAGSQLENRVLGLERRLARSLRWQRGLALLLLLQFALAASEQDSLISEALRTKSLEVVGPDGKPVVVIASDRDGNGGLAVYDANARPIISLEADERGSGAVHAMNPQRSDLAAAFLGVDAHGDGLAGVRSAREKGGASFGIGVHGTGEFTLYNTAGRRIGSFGGDARGAGMLRISDDSQRPVVHIGRAEAANGVVSVFDETGQARVVATN